MLPEFDIADLWWLSVVNCHRTRPRRFWIHYLHVNAVVQFPTFSLFGDPIISRYLKWGLVEHINTVMDQADCFTSMLKSWLLALGFVSGLDRMQLLIIFEF